MIGPPRAHAWLAASLAVALAAAPLAGCESAVKHPATTAGIIGATLGFGTCKLNSDNWGACAAVGGGAGAFLALVAATAIWLGGDGHSIAVEEEAPPPPLEDTRPRRHRTPPAEPATSDPDQSPATAPPVNAPRDPAPANPPSANPPSANPPSATPPTVTAPRL